MLFVGLQLLTWSITGTYMVLMDIDYIHGDSLVANKKQTIAFNNVNYSFSELMNDHSTASDIELGLLLNQSVYRFNDGEQKVMLSAFDGRQLSPIDETLAMTIAKDNYTNSKALITHIQLITVNPPRELSSRHLPAWRIDFDDFASPSFYISANSGQLVTKRHSYWRIFDWMFAFHVMDYIDEEPGNKLLLVFTVLAFIASIFGLVLTYFRLMPKKNKRNSNVDNDLNKEITDEKA
ncbi:hypothetical protein CPS_0734 [Colwellia psychrerythraea 34H]|uniref:PepSY-associated TM helix domain protein n=2 Tax=Colwellia psychrerythraea TaxID=28229 RepID=Q488N0_COLP3|nr:hypothetical protein CPS_0734 [Colwellia psychrerythraea 34H]